MFKEGCKNSIEKGLCKADCCGCTLMKKSLVANNLDKFQVDPEESKDAGDEIVIMTKDGKCIFLDREDFSCAVYDQRPTICKLFGTGFREDGREDLLLFCPHVKPNGNPWSKAKRKRLLRQSNRYVQSMMENIEKNIVTQNI